jgi:hypothetical protein
MAVVRLQATSVGYWRGQVKRWNNTFHYTTSAMTPNYAACLAVASVNLRALGAPAVAGGLASLKLYAAGGGVPLAEQINFPYETPGSWLPWNSSGIWQSTGTPPEAMEAAAVFTIAAGLSSTGKPVTLRTYWHAFVSTPEISSAPQFSSTIQAAAQTQMNKMQVLNDGAGGALVISTPGGRAVAGTCVLDPYVSAHQRVRGRRRKIVTIDGVKYQKAAGEAVAVPEEAD